MGAEEEGEVFMGSGWGDSYRVGYGSTEQGEGLGTDSLTYC